VIGANVGGLPEVVRSGETGFLTGVGDVESMADAAIDLLLDDAKWQRASALAAEDARARFSQAEIVRRYEEFYTYAIDITTRRRARRVSIETPVTST
jgi:glycosyltransferase involved in cell wall biosynthesis